MKLLPAQGLLLTLSGQEGGFLTYRTNDLLPALNDLKLLLRATALNHLVRNPCEILNLIKTVSFLLNQNQNQKQNKNQTKNRKEKKKLPNPHTQLYI